MDLDKLVKVLNERQSVNEMPFETGVKQADTEAAAKTPEELAKLKAKHKAERAEHKAEGDSSTSVGYSKRKGAQEAGDPKGLEKTRSKSQNSSTEYEGPSLAEQVEFIKTFLEGKTTGGDPEATGARMGSFIKRIRKVAPKSGLLQKKEQQASRIAGKMAAKASRQSLGKSHASFTAAGGSENSSTEYEGPSLSEQSEFIKTFLEGHAEERQKRNARRLSQEIESKAHGRWSDKERTKNPESYHGTRDRARTGSRGSNPSDPTLRRRRNRQASLDWKRKENK